MAISASRRDMTIANDEAKAKIELLPLEKEIPDQKWKTSQHKHT
jgi:hypothetical protein